MNINKNKSIKDIKSVEIKVYIKIQIKINQRYKII